VFSCASEREERLIGTWIMVKVKMGGQTQDVTQNDIVIQLLENGEYRTSVKGQVIARGNWNTEKETLILDPQGKEQVQRSKIIKVEKDRIVLLQGKMQAVFTRKE
jgi:hypothetical protein